jgi:hypothetical protein
VSYMTICVPWRVSRKMDKLRTLREHLGSSPFINGVSVLPCVFLHCLSSNCMLRAQWIAILDPQVFDRVSDA